MSQSEGNITISYEREITQPNDYSELRECFINIFGEDQNKNFVFYIKNNLNGFVQIQEGENIKDILKDKKKNIYVKEIKGSLDDNIISKDFEEESSIKDPYNKLLQIKSQNEKENEELIAQINELKKELDEIFNKCKIETTQINKIKEDIKIIEEKIKNKNKDIEEIINIIQNENIINNQLQNDNGVVENLEKEKRVLDNLLKEKEESIIIHKNNYNRLNETCKKKITEMENENLKLLNQLNELKNNFTNKTKEYEDILNTYLKENKELNNQLNMEKGINENLINNEINDKNNKINQLKEENNNLRIKYEKYKKQTELKIKHNEITKNKIKKNMKKKMTEKFNIKLKGVFEDFNQVIENKFNEQTNKINNLLYQNMNILDK